MTHAQFVDFESFRSDFRRYCTQMNSMYGSALAVLQREAARNDTPVYPVETPVVYNTALDEITEQSRITHIVVGDNPGKDEQRSCNQKYLVGQSGKLAAGFFMRNAEFGTDFRKNVIVLNKTPVHTAKTKHLRFLLKNGSPEIQNLIHESQLYMARKTAELHIRLCADAENDSGPELWLVGYSELKENGLFLAYRDELRKSYTDNEHFWESIFVFQHFSMNRFSIDVHSFRESHGNPGIVDSVHELGRMHRRDIFG